MHTIFKKIINTLFQLKNKLVLICTFSEFILSPAGHVDVWPAARRMLELYLRLEAKTITVCQNVDFWQWWLMCALVSRDRDSAKSFFLPIHGRGGRVKGSKLHYRAHRGNIQKRHLYICINGCYIPFLAETLHVQWIGISWFCYLNIYFTKKIKIFKND